jgi:hypothetical protein
MWRRSQWQRAPKRAALGKKFFCLYFFTPLTNLAENPEALAANVSWRADLIDRDLAALCGVKALDMSTSQKLKTGK